MADPRHKPFPAVKTVRMTAAFAKAIEREAERENVSEGEVMRLWLEAGHNIYCTDGLAGRA